MSLCCSPKTHRIEVHNILRLRKHIWACTWLMVSQCFYKNQWWIFQKDFLLRDFPSVSRQNNIARCASKIISRVFKKKSGLLLVRSRQTCVGENTCQKHLFNCNSFVPEEMKMKVSLNSKETLCYWMIVYKSYSNSVSSCFFHESVTVKTRAILFKSSRSNFVYVSAENYSTDVFKISQIQGRVHIFIFYIHQRLRFTKI